MNKKYRSALIGLGNVAYKLGRDRISGASLCHSASYGANDQTTLVGGYGPMEDDRVKFSQHLGVPSYENLNEMLNTLRPDIVSICSPDSAHLNNLLTCFEHDIPMVWLEKPMADNSHDTQDILKEYAKRKSCNTKVLVSYQRRYTHSYIHLKKIIESEEYGAVLNVEVRYSKGLLTNGSHMVDLLYFLFGEVAVDILWAESGSDQSGIKSNPSFVLMLNKRLKVFFLGSQAPYHNIDIVVTFENGRLSINHGGMTPVVERKVEHELFEGFYRLSQTQEDSLGCGGYGSAFDEALNDLILSYEEDRQPVSNPMTARYSADLIDRILT